MPKKQRCSVSGCPGIAISGLDNHSFCLEHFMLTCEETLEDYHQRIKEHRLGPGTAEAMRQFVLHSIREADRIEQRTKGLSDLQRTRLLQVMLAAAELGRHVRRSARRIASIAVRISSEKPQDLWEEETETLVISRWGALVRCQRPFEIDRKLRLVRKDNGQQAHARIAWCKSDAPPGIAIEFLDSDNFWSLDWSVTETAT